jgi:hypothetical protein
VYILDLVLSIAMDLICIEYMGCDGTNIEKADENETGLEDLREESVANGESQMRT